MISEIQMSTNLVKLWKKNAKKRKKVKGNLEGKENWLVKMELDQPADRNDDQERTTESATRSTKGKTQANYHQETELIILAQPTDLLVWKMILGRQQKLPK